MWKRFVIAALFALVATTAFAKEFKFVACTADNFTVAITLDLNDAAIKKNPGIPKGVAAAFKTTATALRLDQVITYEGYVYFYDQLKPEERAALPNEIDHPSILSNSCK